MKFPTFVKVAFVAVAGFLASASAHALGTPIDLAEVTLQFGEITIGIIAVGSLILIAASIAVSYSWIKRVMGR